MTTNGKSGASEGGAASSALAWAALIVSIAALILAYQANQIAAKSSPDYYAGPDDLYYTFVETNGLTADAKPEWGQLTVFVHNSGDTPARDVQVTVMPLTSSPTINCDQLHTVADAVRNQKLVTIKRIPPKSKAEIIIRDEVNKYPLSWAMPFGGFVPKYEYCASVADIQTQFGSISCLRSESKFHITLLPDDEQALREYLVVHPDEKYP